jgi:soluble lytic murein transglycosylase-like protein
MSKGYDGYDSYYPPALNGDTIVTRIQREYDEYRAHRHNIDREMAESIRHAATSNNIPLGLAFSLVKVESSFTTTAVSHAGAVGLTQVMPATGVAHCGLQRAELLEPEPNLHCGMSYLRMLFDRYSDWSVALAAYNVGDTRRRRAHLTGEPDGSWYAERVLDGSS